MDFAILSLLLLGLYLIPLPDRYHFIKAHIMISGLILFCLFTLFVLLVVGLKWRGDRILLLLEKALSFLRKEIRAAILKSIWNFSQGIVTMDSPFRVYMTLFLSYLLWGLTLVQIFLVCRSLNIMLPFEATFTVLIMATLGVSVPSGPGFVGTFHLSVQYALILFGVGKEEALSAAILWHASFFLPTVVLALIIIIANHVPIRQLLRPTPP